MLSDFELSNCELSDRELSDCGLSDLVVTPSPVQQCGFESRLGLEFSGFCG